MSLNIPSDVIAVAAAVKVTIDTSKFGPKQITSFHRALKSGLCADNGVPSIVAKAIRKERGLPWVHFSYRGWVKWGNVPKEAKEFFEYMTAAMVADDMKQSTAYSHYWEDHKIQGKKQLLKKMPAGETYFMSGKETVKSVMKHFKFDAEVGEYSRLIDVDLQSTSFSYWD